MKPRLYSVCSIAVFLWALLVAEPAAAQSSFALLHSLFDPGAGRASNNTFGISVAVSGSRVVVGTPAADASPIRTGATYVYDLTSDTSTVPVLVLTNRVAEVNGGFGFSVAISGTRVVVGNPFDDTGASGAGIAYVYDVTSATPAVPMLTLTNPSPKIQDWFGRAVAISDTHVVVGAYYDDTGAPYAGSAYVYDLASAMPAVPALTLTNPTPARSDIFSVSVAIFGTWVVVGAYLDDTGSTDAGSAYVYDLAGATPAGPALTLTNPSPVAGDVFGCSIAISGKRVVVGARGRDIERSLPGSFYGDAGSAYVYDLTSATPTVPVATLNNPNPAHFDNFGWSVAISGTRVVVGAVYDDAEVDDVGSAYVYDLASASPNVPVAILTNPSPAFDDRFGYSVAIDGTTIVIGTPLDDTNGRDSGAAYIFGLVPALSIVPAAPGLATILWRPDTPSGFVLQYADSLAPTNWVNAPSGALNPVTIPLTNATRFYRLVQP